MSNWYKIITQELKEFIAAQKVFFVATAPTEGRINLSPKGMDTFRVINPNRVIYLDITGSGNETAAHLLQNGRLTFMFCAFEGKPMILRLFGRGRALQPPCSEYVELSSKFPELPGVRQIFVAEITRVQTSCGFGVPFMKFEKERDLLTKWCEHKGPQGLAEYREKKNRLSIDNLPTA